MSISMHFWLDNAISPSLIVILSSGLVCAVVVVAAAVVGQRIFRTKRAEVFSSPKLKELAEPVESLEYPKTVDRCRMKIPKHIAVIMDGNRRFGRMNHSNPLQGHWNGGQKLIDFVQWCIEDGVSLLTVYAFSTENWNRDPNEVKALMEIFVKYAEKLKTESIARNIRVNIFTTDSDRLPKDVQVSIDQLHDATSTCSGFTINICLSYGSRSEIVHAAKLLSRDVSSGQIHDHDIDEALFSRYLLTKDIPDPDILIRTSGEFRISNFLLWQLAYAELFFIPKLWPEITQDDLRSILVQYADRDRRYGK